MGRMKLHNTVHFIGRARGHEGHIPPSARSRLIPHIQYFHIHYANSSVDPQLDLVCSSTPIPPLWQSVILWICPCICSRVSVCHSGYFFVLV